MPYITVIKSPKAAMREGAEQGEELVCLTCGGNLREGCKLNAGMDIFACPKFQPLQ
tara:strand:+ start:180 stop:347 length:168 start_codon:yes stop_codon:yes gene_type:complete